MAVNNNHFELNLDTIAPVGSIKCTTAERAYIKENTSLTVVFGDAAFYYFWFDKNAVTDASSPKITRKASAEECSDLFDAWEDRSSGTSVMKILTQTSPKTFTNAEIKTKTAESACATDFKVADADGVYYYHIVLMDNVGNESIICTTQPIVLDRSPVELSTAVITSPDGRTDFTNSITNSLNATYVAPTASEAPIDHFEIRSSALDNSAGKDYLEATSLPATITWKEGTTEGNITVSIIAVDKAGNRSTNAAITSIYFDDQPATAIVILKNEAGTANLPEWVNSARFTAEIDANDPGTSPEADIVAYKLWGDVVGKTQPGEWIYKDESHSVYEDPIVISGLEFTNSADHSLDGEKTVYIKVMDKAGNVYPVDPAVVSSTTHLDTFAPTASLEATTAVGTWFSDRPGYNTVTVTPTVVNTGADGKKSDIASYVLKVNGNVVSTEIKDSYTLTSADGFVVGTNNSITLTVTDVAGNSVTSEPVSVSYDNDSTGVKLGFTIDSLAKHWHNTHFGINLSNITDGAGAGVRQFKVWVDGTATFDVYNDVIPTRATTLAYVSGSTRAIAAGDIAWEDTEGDNKYIHVVAFDLVDNRYEQHISYGWDVTKPTVRFDAPTQGEVFTNPLVTLTIDADGTVSQPVLMKITGNIENPDTDFVDFAAQKTVTLTSGDGNKTITISVIDEAGNVVETPYSVTVELDETTPHAVLEIRNPDDAKSKDSPSNVADFVARVSYTDDPLENQVEYRLHGTNFEGSMADFEPYTPDTGLNYKKITGLKAINEGTVTVYLTVRDNAGHTDTTEAFTWIYDNTPPEVTATGVDFYIVSKVHELRQSSDKFCDEVHFEFFIAKADGSWDTEEKYKAFKVCAYKDKADAAAGTHDDAAIPTTAGSINMSDSDLDQNSKINALIKGADYEAALVARGLTATEFEADGKTVKTAGTAEGIHYVVVYMQDAGGTWSKAASFEA